MPGQQSDVYARAQRAFIDKDFQEAAHLFEAVAASEQQRPTEARTDALLMQAKSLVKLGVLQKSEAVLRSYLQQDHSSAPALYLLGCVLQRENKPRDSLEVFTLAAAITTPRSEELRIVALDYVLLEDYRDAIHWLNRSLASDPSNAEAWYDLGRAQMHQEHFVESEQAFEQTLKINPLHVRALDNLGLSYEALNRTDDALAAYSRAVAAQKSEPHPSEQPFLNFGTLLNTQGSWGQAIASLEQAVALAPTCSRCHEELSRAYAGAHRQDLAREHMEKAVALDPDNPRLHYQLGQIYRRAGLIELGKSELTKSVKLFGNQSSSRQQDEIRPSAPTAGKLH